MPPFYCFCQRGTDSNKFKCNSPGDCCWPGMDRATVARIQTAYESQHSPFTMAEARRDVSNILGEHEEEPRSVRDR